MRVTIIVVRPWDYIIVWVFGIVRSTLRLPFSGRGCYWHDNLRSRETGLRKIG